MDGERGNGEYSVLSHNTKQRLQSRFESQSCCALPNRPPRPLPVLKQRPTTPEKFENAALFLRLWPPSTLIRHKNALQTSGIWKRWLFVLIWTGNILKTERWRDDNHVISLTEFSQIQNDRWLLRLPIPPAWCGGKTFDAISVKPPYLSSETITCGP